MTTPTPQDANRDGMVLLWRGIHGWVACPWRDVKPEDKWKRGTIPKRRWVKRVKSVGAWS